MTEIHAELMILSYLIHNEHAKMYEIAEHYKDVPHFKNPLLYAMINQLEESGLIIDTDFLDGTRKDITAAGMEY